MDNLGARVLHNPPNTPRHTTPHRHPLKGVTSQPYPRARRPRNRRRGTARALIAAALLYATACLALLPAVALLATADCLDSTATEADPEAADSDPAAAHQTVTDPEVVDLDAACADTPTASSWSSGRSAWGGYINGRIPLVALCPIDRGGRHLLRCDAAQAFTAMAAAYHAEFGRPLGITDAYRDYAAQVDVYRRKPRLAATPGTSRHGWGLAVDLAVGGWTSPTFRWLQTHAPRYGWHHPPWATLTGPKPEPWHWEFES